VRVPLQYRKKIASGEQAGAVDSQGRGVFKMHPLVQLLAVSK